MGPVHFEYKVDKVWLQGVRDGWEFELFGSYSSHPSQQGGDPKEVTLWARGFQLGTIYAQHDMQHEPDLINWLLKGVRS